MLARACVAMLALAALVLAFASSYSMAESSTQALQDHLDRFAREDRLYNVVHISSAQAKGYGLIIGRDFESLLVLTVRHILPQGLVDEANGPEGRVTVRLYGFETEWLASPGEVYVLTPSDRVQDIAVIKVLVPRFPPSGGGDYLVSDSWREKVVDADPEIGARIEIAATVGNIGYAGGHARIGTTQQGRPVSFEDLVGHPGQSGAPIATDRGFVAIYLGSGVKQAIPLVDIRDALVAEFGAPFWGLIPVDPRPESTRLCVHIVGAHVSEVTVSGPISNVVLNSRGCGSTYTGRHSIIANQFGLVCTPASFLVTRDTRESFAITCYTDPSGAWSASGQGFLHLEFLEEGRWELTLNLPRNRGQIRGTVTGSPPNLYLNDGLFRGRTAVSGSIVVEGNALRIDLFTGSDFFEGVYRR